MGMGVTSRNPRSQVAGAQLSLHPLWPGLGRYGDNAWMLEPPQSLTTGNTTHVRPQGGEKGVVLQPRVPAGGAEDQENTAGTKVFPQKGKVRCHRRNPDVGLSSRQVAMPTPGLGAGSG